MGDDVDYASSMADANVNVKKTASKIIASNLNMIPKMAEYYTITLKDGNNNPLTNQKVTFKVVNSFPDLKVQFVDSFADYKVKVSNSSSFSKETIKIQVFSGIFMIFADINMKQYYFLLIF